LLTLPSVAAVVVVVAAVVPAAVAEDAAAAEVRKMVGIGFRQELANWIESRPAGIDCLEITAEHFFHGREMELAALRHDFTLFVHGLGLSLGTPGPLDVPTVEKFARVVTSADPEWISEHIAFTRTADYDLGHLNPVPPTRAMAKIIAGHAREIVERCGRPIILENITSHLRLEGELSETDFLNEICMQADCGLLLDVTNLFINSRNHQFDPLAWLHALDSKRIVQLHIVGYARDGARFTDDHAHPIQEELLELAREILAYAPARAIILERDAAFPDPELMRAEIRKLASLFERN
jgi:uncharacterized protein (UPF0276 family)